MTTSKKVDRVAVSVVGCFALFLLALAGSAVLFVIWLRSLNAGAPVATGDPGESPPPGQPGEPLAPEPCAAPPGKKKERSEPLRAQDTARTEPSELYDQARALALGLEPNAKLVGIGAHALYPRAQGGTFDAAQDSLSFRFEYRCLAGDAAAAQPPHQGVLEVVARNGALQATRAAGADTPALAGGRALSKDAPCSTAAAWATAVASGLPADRSAVFLYVDAAGPETSPVWLVTVAGPPPREIDGQTCRLRANSPLHPHVSDPGAELLPLHPTAQPSPSDPTPVATASAMASAGAPQEEPRPGGTPSADAPAASSPPPGKAAAATSSPPAAAPGPGRCTIRVDSSPPSQVFVDGRPVGSTPKVDLPVTCGAHTVRLKHRELGQKDVSVSAHPSKPASLYYRFGM